MLADPVKVALIGHRALALYVHDPAGTAAHWFLMLSQYRTPSVNRLFALTWNKRRTPASVRRTIVFTRPCRLVPLLLYFTLKPKLFLDPMSPALEPAVWLLKTRYPPPV